MPHAQYSAAHKRLKGEDVAFAREGRVLAQDGPTWSLYCLASGHGGAGAANYVRQRLWRVLGPLLPSTHIPDHEGQEFEDFAQRCRVAVVKAFMKVGEQFRAEAPSDTSGTAVVAALLCGRLLTVVNVGDGGAVLDADGQPRLLTPSHDIASNAAERRRLVDSGAIVAHQPPSVAGPARCGERSATGSLRVWPGGATVSRSIGDNGVGDSSLSCPHVCQVLIPASGVRLLMGSRHLWDTIHWENAATVTRSTPIKDAASTLIDLAALLGSGSPRVEMSAIVVGVAAKARTEPCHAATGIMGIDQVVGEGKDGAGIGCVASDRRGFRSTSPKTHRRVGETARKESDCSKARVVANLDGWGMARAVLEAHNDSCSSLMEMKNMFGTDLASTARHCRRSAGYSYPERIKVPRGGSPEGQLQGTGMRIGAVTLSAPPSSPAVGVEQSDCKVMCAKSLAGCQGRLGMVGCMPKAGLGGVKWWKRGCRGTPTTEERNVAQG